MRGKNMSQRKYYCGIDPGIYGSVVVIDNFMNVSFFSDMPLITIGGRKCYDNVMLIKIIDKLLEYYPTICIEAQQAMPHQHAVGTFNTGYGYGLLVGMITCAGLKYFTCRPQIWQKKALAGQPGKGKMRAIIRCEQLFPKLPLGINGGRKIFDGRADAAMIAYYSYLLDSGKDND